MRKILVQYIYDHKFEKGCWRRPVAVMVAIKIDKPENAFLRMLFGAKDRVSIGVAYCNKTDPFVKSYGRRLALDRAELGIEVDPPARRLIVDGGTYKIVDLNKESKNYIERFRQKAERFFGINKELQVIEE